MSHTCEHGVTTGCWGRNRVVCAACSLKWRKELQVQVEGLTSQNKRLQKTWQDFCEAIDYPNFEPRYRHFVLSHARALLKKANKFDEIITKLEVAQRNPSCHAAISKILKEYEK